MSDSPPPIPRRTWLSFAVVMFVQTQNAFNDNFVKMVLLGLGLAAAQGIIVLGIDLGDKIQYILSMMIPLPFILAAPISGWVSDRFSKRDVIIWSLLFQITVFTLIWLAVVNRNVHLALLGFLLLAVQSTAFSPAKQGILKELVGSERLGMANGMMQMLTMIGILAGMGLGGSWFDQRLAAYNELNGVGVDNAWIAANAPILYIGLLSLLPAVISFWIQKTPSYPTRRFKHSIWLQHFHHLGLLLKNANLRILAIRIGLYWFVAHFIALVAVTFGKQLFPDAVEGGAAQATAMMMLCVGGGLLLGSSLVSVLCRSRIRVELIPMGGFGMGLGLIGMIVMDPSGVLFKLSLGLIGFFSGFFLIPQTALLQDQAPDAERATIISASNLINSLVGIVAILACNAMDSWGWIASHQVILITVLMLMMTAWTLPYLKRTV